jgi:SMI1-KNR4 cell-wall
MKLELKNSFPTILSDNTSDGIYRLFVTLPADYKHFLSETNGGFADEFKYTFKTGVPFITKDVNNPSRTDCVIEFFGICATGNESDESPKNLLETIEEYESEAFLPSGIIPIACCIQSSLVCISLRKDDFGQIYYWDRYWKYPWCSDFFYAKIDAVSAIYNNADEILGNPENEQYQAVSDAFNYATVVKIADSFEDFLSVLYDTAEKE